jgi:hypothetical protein
MKKALAVAVLAALSAPALAADPAWYVYGAAGQTKLDISKSDLDADVRDITGTTPSSTLDNSDTGFTLQLGYRVAPNLAVEGGWFDLGKAVYKANAGGGLTVNEDVKASGFGISGVGIIPIANKFSGVRPARHDKRQGGGVGHGERPRGKLHDQRLGTEVEADVRGRRDVRRGGEHGAPRRVQQVLQARRQGQDGRGGRDDGVLRPDVPVLI